MNTKNGSSDWKKRTENVLSQLEKQAASAQLWDLAATLCCAINALKRTQGGDLCPLCKSELRYCPQGCYCSSDTCRYAC